MSEAAVNVKEEQTVSTVSVSRTAPDGSLVTVSTVKVRRWARTLHHKNLARSIGAIASLAGAVSVLVGVLATRMAPHGWARVTTALHMTKKPLLVQLAPFIAGFAVTAACVAGLLSFYSWYREMRDAKLAASVAAAGTDITSGR
jgi:hypothetical protein